MGGNKILGGVRKVVDPWGVTGGENIFGGKLYKGKFFGKNAGSGFTKMLDPLGLFGGENIFGGRTYGSPQRSSYYNPYDFKAMQGMMQNNTSNQMMSDMLTQQAKANQASVTQKTNALESANAAQQSNIAANVAQAGTQALGFRAPVKTTFTPANTFSSPDLSGLTFGGK